MFGLGQCYGFCIFCYGLNDMILYVFYNPATGWPQTKVPTNNHVGKSPTISASRGASKLPASVTSNQSMSKSNFIGWDVAAELELSIVETLVPHIACDSVVLLVIFTSVCIEYEILLVSVITTGPQGFSSKLEAMGFNGSTCPRVRVRWQVWN